MRSHKTERRPLLSRLAAGLIILAAYCPATAHAATELTEINKFSFGKFALKDNSTPQTLSISGVTNTASASAGFVIDTPAQRGEYRLTGFIPGTEVYVTIQDGTLRLNGSGASAFTTVNYTISPTNLVADGSGRIDFYIGATLRTMGNSVNYPTGLYNDDLDIRFDWIE